MCSSENALPGAVHLICRYEDNLGDALIENIMAGGDSSARGIFTGLILGCYQGLSKVPDNWTTDMIAYDVINKLM